MITSRPQLERGSPRSRSPGSRDRPPPRTLRRKRRWHSARRCRFGPAPSTPSTSRHGKDGEHPARRQIGCRPRPAIAVDRAAMSNRRAKRPLVGVTQPRWATLILRERLAVDALAEPGRGHKSRGTGLGWAGTRWHGGSTKPLPSGMKCDKMRRAGATRPAHNPEVAGSNPAPATGRTPRIRGFLHFMAAEWPPRSPSAAPSRVAVGAGMQTPVDAYAARRARSFASIALLT